MPNIPKDPVILLSYINTRLRDQYNSLEDCCLALGIEIKDLEDTLSIIDYHYNKENNQFI